MVAFLVILPFILAVLLVGVWAERKIAGFISDRLGPTEVGFKGLLQVAADGLKLIQKESIVPTSADKWVFLAGPIVIFVAVFAGFATMPLAPELVGSGIKTGVFFLLAIVSLDVVGFLMAGWGSNNKFSMLGAMRGVAQIVSYEIPLGLTVLVVVMMAGSLDLTEIVAQQGIFSSTTGETLYGIEDGLKTQEVGGILAWNVVKAPFLVFALLIFFIASLAEANRAPFDIPEAESEIIAGFLTEYSGFRWSIIMLAEYTMMVLVGMLGVSLFLGGWNTPLPNIGSLDLATKTQGVSGELSGYIWGTFWFFSKTALWIFAQIWVRWTYPRMRVDQLMFLSWKVLTPAALALIFVMGIWKIWIG